MKIIYAGSPQFSIPPLEKLLSKKFDIIAVLTQPDRPFGRKGILTATPIKNFAKAQNIPVFTFEKIANSVQELQALQADCLITSAYGQILTQEVLNLFQMGVYNIHASILPRWRGASPIQHALLHGDRQTGISIMKTDVGLDTGDIVLQKTLDITQEDNASLLFDKLSHLGAECIVEAMEILQYGQINLQKQAEDGVTICKKIIKKECQIDFNKSTKEIVQLVKAMECGPVAYSHLQGQLVNFYDCKVAIDKQIEQEGMDKENGTILAVQKNGIFIKANDGIIQATVLQFAGSKKITSQDIYNGKKLERNQIFKKEE